jgi:peptidoglycan/xylan/chitin deacetylase (PgdA/CDA1 family)
LHAYPIGNTQRNAKYVQQQMTRNFSTALCPAVAALMTFVAAAPAAECPRKDALGTSRVLAVDAATYPRVGLKSFPQTLPLDDREVVLTFDDGPWPPTDQKIWRRWCMNVRATFFLIGKTTSEHPELVRRIAAQGHTRGIAVFGADLWASDWTPMTPAQQLKLLTERLQVARKGIILLHDPKAQTAAMLPAFLRYLRDNRYRVVHLVPAGAKTVSGKAH